MMFVKFFLFSFVISTMILCLHYIFYVPKYKKFYDVCYKKTYVLDYINYWLSEKLIKEFFEVKEKFCGNIPFAYHFDTIKKGLHIKIYFVYNTKEYFIIFINPYENIISDNVNNGLDYIKRILKYEYTKEFCINEKEFNEIKKDFEDKKQLNLIQDYIKNSLKEDNNITYYLNENGK